MISLDRNFLILYRFVDIQPIYHLFHISTTVPGAWRAATRTSPVMQPSPTTFWLVVTHQMKALVLIEKLALLPLQGSIYFSKYLTTDLLPWKTHTVRKISPMDSNLFIRCFHHWPINVFFLGPADQCLRIPTTGYRFIHASTFSPCFWVVTVVKIITLWVNLAGNDIFPTHRLKTETKLPVKIRKEACTKKMRKEEKNWSYS